MGIFCPPVGKNLSVKNYKMYLYEPMVRLNIDFVGPFSDGGYILTIINTFTRWVELYVYAKVLMHKKPLVVYLNTLADSKHPHRYSLIEVLTS